MPGARRLSEGRTAAWRIAARTFALALLVLGPARAEATQEYILPTLFDVTGVAADDVLNIRSAPSAGAAIVGTLPHDARGIEVVAHDRSGRWGRVNTDGRSGWASLRYLEYRTDVWREGRLPPAFRCLGTEPFWGFRTSEGELRFSTPDAPDRMLELESVLSTGIFRDPHRALIARSPERRLTAAIVPVACSDGMSDRAYGLEANVILEGQEAPRLLTGCCSIAP